MQLKTTGIVLHAIKYSDSASIVTIYTRHFGRVSYMVHGINKKKSICRSALFQPLSIVDLDVFHSPGKELQKIRDIKIVYPFTGIPINPIKNALALFLSEMLYRALRQTEPDESLFLFLENSIQQLDCCEKGISNFHLVCLVKMTRYLGFEPNQEDGENEYFDLINGVFLREKPLHTHFLLPAVCADFEALLRVNYSDLEYYVISRTKRIKLLEVLVEYYRLHVPDFHGLQSIAVLHSLFD